MPIVVDGLAAFGSIVDSFQRHNTAVEWKFVQKVPPLPSYTAPLTLLSGLGVSGALWRRL